MILLFMCCTDSKVLKGLLETVSDWEEDVSLLVQLKPNTHEVQSIIYTQYFLYCMCR